ncbi:hypothetical protein B0H14DRAFT_2918132 [Mycena olivaceomarginata]|nr:hypothetical protein B0H14DRAFT_2918132 [Mycena olivaceomarginata]
MPKPSVISMWRIEIFVATSLFHPTMSLTATFHNLALSTSFNSDLESSSLSLNWLVVVSSLPSDLVSGRNWMSYCRCSFPDAHFVLDSGYVHTHPPSTSILPISILSCFLLYMSSDLH